MPEPVTPQLMQNLTARTYAIAFALLGRTVQAVAMAETPFDGLSPFSH